LLNEINIADMLSIAIQAGREILTVYSSGDFQVEQKADKSPLTLADKRSHAAIVRGLEALGLGIPVLSEEGRSLPFSERMAWEYLWVVDPLDGTKEFIKRNGEFTVNIALVHRNEPVLGVIYAPVLDVAYYAKSGLGAFRLDNAQKAVVESETMARASVKLPLDRKRDSVNVVASRLHGSTETEDYLNKLRAKYGNIEVHAAGSSLKLCLVAEGQADVYPRFAPTMEWDTCAGQAIVEQSGGHVHQVDSHEPLRYNKEELLNPWFIAVRADFEV